MIPPLPIPQVTNGDSALERRRLPACLERGLPSLTRVFSTDQSVRVFARARWKSERDTIEGSITLIGASSFTPQRLTMSGAVLKSGHREATVDRGVSFDGVQSGRYVLRVDVWGANGERTQREIPIDVK